MSISILIGFKRPKSQGSVLSGTIQGGLRIRSNDTEVMELTDQDNITGKSQKRPDQTLWYDYQGNELGFERDAFKGSYIEPILASLSKKTKQMKKGEVDRFEQITVELVDSPHILVFSYLDDSQDLIRITFQSEQIGGKGQPKIESAIGYSVPSDELCLEVAQCLREYLEYAQRSGFDPRNWDSLKRLKSDADELEELSNG